MLTYWCVCVCLPRATKIEQAELFQLLNLIILAYQNGQPASLGIQRGLGDNNEQSHYVMPWRREGNSLARQKASIDRDVPCHSRSNGLVIHSIIYTWQDKKKISLNTLPCAGRARLIEARQEYLWHIRRHQAQP